MIINLEYFMEQYITMGLNILLLVFVFFGFFMGIIRGLKKTVSRAVFLILTAIIALFITIPVTNLFLGIKFDANIDIMGTNYQGNMTIKEVLTLFIEGLVGPEVIANNPEILQLVLSVPLMLIHIFLYVLLFWVLKYLLLPFNAIFHRFTLGRKQKVAFGFSAFNNDPNNINNIYNLGNNNISQDNDLGITPLPTDNEFEHHQEDQEKSEFQSAEEEPAKPVDNSIFQPSSQNEAGLFIIKDPEESKKTKEPVFNVSISSNTPKEEKPAKKKKQKKEKVKVKKYRLWGGLLGMILGLFIMSNTLMPIYGIFNILSTINKVKLQNISDTEISLDIATDGISTEILHAYDLSLLKTLSTYTGLEGLALAEFDYLTTETIDGNEISLRADINNIIATTEKVDALIGKFKDFAGDGNFSNLTKEQIKILLNDTKSLLGYIKNIKLISTSTNLIIPITCNALLNSSTNMTNNDNINAIITDLITAIKQENIYLFDEFNSILDVFEYLNERNVLTKILNNDYSQPIEIINSLDSTFTEKLFKVKTLSVTLPHIINISLALLDENLEYGFIENDANAITIKNAVCDFIDKIINFARTIDTNSSILVTNESLVPLGRVLEVIKSSGLIKTETYQNLVDYTINTLQDLITDIVPDDFDNYVKNELLVNISKVDNWEYEMLIINDGILKLRDVENGILGDVVEGKNIRQGLSINIIMKEGVLINLGKALDILEESCIFGARTYKDNHQISGIVSLITNILQFTNSTIIDEFDSGSSMQKINIVIDEMKTNIIKSNHTYNKENPFWENEFTNIAPLIVTAYDMFNAENFNFDNSLGKNLDKAKGSTMLGNGATITLMNVALDIVEETILGEDYEYNDGTDLSTPQDINDKIYELFTEININLKTNTVKEQVRTQSNFWEKEIEYYTSLKNIADKATEITTISDAVEMAEDLDHVYQSYTIPRSGINKIIAFAIRDTKYKNLDSDDKVKLAINDTIEDIATKLEDEAFFDGKNIKDFWTIEFNHIKNMTEIKFNDEVGYSVKDNLNLIGKDLDKVCLGYSISDDPNTSVNEAKTIRGSYLITHANLRNILGSAIDEMSDSLTNSFDNNIKNIVSTALGGIKGNVMDVTNIPTISFEFELGKLKTLSNLDLSSDLVTYPTGTDAEIISKLNANKVALQTLGTELDNIAFNYKKESSFYVYSDTDNSKIITRQIINTLIKDMFDLGNVTINDYDEDSTKTKKNAFNNLIDSIQNEIMNHSEKDHIISWKRELGYVNTLITLNKDTVYTVNNAATEIGRNIDTIAFNYLTSGSSSSFVYSFNDIKYINDDCLYIPANNGNSLFITRDALRTAMAGFMSTVKTDPTDIVDDLEKEQAEIVNSIIDNVTLKVSSTNENLNSGNMYFDMEAAFIDLQSIDTKIKNTIDSLASKDITSLNGNTSIGTTFDSLLNDLETMSPACGVINTRRIAILILKHIDIPTTPINLTQTAAGRYHAQLLNYYTNNIASTASENYSTEKPFETLFNKSITL